MPSTSVPHIIPWSLHAAAVVPQSAAGNPPITRPSVGRPASAALIGRPFPRMPPSTTPTTMPSPRLPAAQMALTPRYAATSPIVPLGVPGAQSQVPIGHTAMPSSSCVGGGSGRSVSASGTLAGSTSRTAPKGSIRPSDQTATTLGSAFSASICAGSTKPRTMMVASVGASASLPGLRVPEAVGDAFIGTGSNVESNARPGSAPATSAMARVVDAAARNSTSTRTSCPPPAVVGPESITPTGISPCAVSVPVDVGIA